MEIMIDLNYWGLGEGISNINYINVMLGFFYSV